ncbi:hypothetical protein GWI33_013015 [Rhynchophorus ferrugineus]|uniref:Uncharacterized protein n=1 Tax=Rhynchophorus ferrugineus TaxID=354439 RepID=A0A834M715_RHYFE|nr:hypothetical protein GWI33_013015 [Rhynchophorus ferrugineus]
MQMAFSTRPNGGELCCIIFKNVHKEIYNGEKNLTRHFCRSSIFASLEEAAKEKGLIGQQERIIPCTGGVKVFGRPKKLFMIYRDDSPLALTNWPRNNAQLSQNPAGKSTIPGLDVVDAE